MRTQKRPVRLFGMLCCLMTLFIAWQWILLAIHYQVSDIFQSIAGTSLAHDLFHFPILLPIFANILLQIVSYALIVIFCWLIARGVGEKFNLSSRLIYCLGIFCLTLAITDLLALNSYYFPLSFFAIKAVNDYFLLFSALFWAITMASAIHKIKWPLIIFIAVNVFGLLPLFLRIPTYPAAQPNIILIGLDSLRPDFIHFYGKRNTHTPTIDAFLQEATVFDQAYTPLARTFPTWVSILTAQHPKHHGVRNNLANSTTLLNHDMLAKTLQQSGYHTLYASDEKRFSNITPAFGFDEIIGPTMGVNDFILGGLTDFPITNLLTKLPIAKFILPYNYANRAAAITYQPTQLITLMNSALTHRPSKPLFLAVHLCLAHWPYTWANTPAKNDILPQQYQHSVEALDQQLNDLLTLLKHHGLLENSIVVLLSDHGTTLGLPHDTLLDKKHYLGSAILLKNIPIVRLSHTSPDSLDFKHDYASHTAYGQGTNVASLKQYHPLLAFRRYGKDTFVSQRITTAVSLTDIAPTLLALLKLPPLKHTDGISLLADLKNISQNRPSSRAFFTETGDSLSEIETDRIFLEKVLAKKVGLYQVNPQTALLTINPIAERAVIKNKQRAIIWRDWLLAWYPSSTREKLVQEKNTTHMKFKTFTIPAYYVLINLHSGQWTVGLDSAFAKSAPVATLQKQLHDFYGDEI